MKIIKIIGEIEIRVKYSFNYIYMICFWYVTNDDIYTKLQTKKNNNDSNKNIHYCNAFFVTLRIINLI